MAHSPKFQRLVFFIHLLDEASPAKRYSLTGDRARPDIGRVNWRDTGQGGEEAGLTGLPGLQPSILPASVSVERDGNWHPDQIAPLGSHSFWAPAL